MPDAEWRWRCLNKLRITCLEILTRSLAPTFTHVDAHIKSSDVQYRGGEIGRNRLHTMIQSYAMLTRKHTNIMPPNMLYCSTLSSIRYTRISYIHLNTWNQILNVNICVNTSISRSLTNIIRSVVLLLLLLCFSSAPFALHAIPWEEIYGESRLLYSSHMNVDFVWMNVTMRMFSFRLVRR